MTLREVCGLTTEHNRVSVSDDAADDRPAHRPGEGEDT